MSRPSLGAEKIIRHLRDAGAYHDSNGITFTTEKLGKSIGLTDRGVGKNIRKLISAEIIFVKRGRYGSGGGGRFRRGTKERSSTPYFVLAEGYEQGDSWEEKLRITNKSTTSSSESTAPKPSGDRSRHLASLGSLEMIKAHAETMAKLEQSLVDNNKLREELLQALKGQDQLAKKMVAMEAEMAELRDNEREAQRQLIDADNAVAMASRRIAKQEQIQVGLERQISAHR